LPEHELMTQVHAALTLGLEIATDCFAEYEHFSGTYNGGGISNVGLNKGG
jgi:hypothetical protein